MTISEEGSYFYDVVISTGVWRNSGTTANVNITITGETDELRQVLLRGEGDSGEIFSRGSVKGFALITSESIGPLKGITLEHDNSGESPS